MAERVARLACVRGDDLRQPRKAHGRLRQKEEGAGVGELGHDSGPQPSDLVPELLGEREAGGQAGQARSPQKEGEAEVAQDHPQMPT